MENLSIVDLPDDVLLAIFTHCDYKTLLKVTQVCKTFSRLASQDVLWRKISERCLNMPVKQQRQADSNIYDVATCVVASTEKHVYTCNVLVKNDMTHENLRIFFMSWHA